MQRVIYDQFGTAIRVLHAKLDDPTGDFGIETIEDCEPIVDEVKALRDQQRARGDMKHVARVPLSVAEKAMREGWFNDPEAWRRWANNPDNRDFRVWEGQV